MTIASCAVMNTSGTPPAATRSSRSGTGAHCVGGHREQLGLPAAAGDAEHAGADRGLGDAGAVRDDLARELEPGMSGGDPGGAA